MKHKSLKVALVAAIAAGGLVLSTGSAFASGLGGDVYTTYCHAYVASAGPHYGYGVVTGASNCLVNLWQYNVNTGGSSSTGFYYGSTPSKYHADGVHELQVEVYDPNTGADAWGPLVY
ncbi:hypothetical protein AMES_3688 [Amycolatopsis mediterranei S699]|uniref:Secreted protein n=2 Tax=Amycolatopsis mediterranei TaxID=33910 RepID=A0A0H3D5G0_AMYMU|nr:hypothetical protein [Amycolatopsis mediterranei]ADJ45512.1 hypothetical protein AMED_3732 [Amycolatopsis mediterranei U32]AEK42287.1 hypothetical protein RAM_19005 [Amycolatopsis mediterranei S699]AFO77224.1 hypothetical protein AMES_3688 [Amycolatopsis mediterranei S699]AGT84352.1 hypothetical protein B737_3688 [Amycolatopsis mediterranei RB]KDO06092.1 hypothetical protein DV26_36010 [Amycolatopsis mediterranei]